MTQTKSPALIYAEAHNIQHDISHCNPKEDETIKCHFCKRYAAHLQLFYNQEKYNDGLYSYFSDPYNSCILQDHKMYIPLN